MQVPSRLFLQCRWPAAGVALLAAVLTAIATIQPSLAGETGRRVLADCFLWLVLAVPVAVAAWRAWAWLWDLGYDKSGRRWIWLIVIVAYAAGFVFVRVFLDAEHDIRVYDSTVYWINVIADQRLVSESIPAYLANLRDTFSHEYNHLAALPLIPVARWLGVDFAGYCLSVLYVYYLPACFFISILVLRMARLANADRPLPVPAFAACFSLCALCVPFLWPVMNGYLDVAGVLIFAFMLNVALHWDCTKFSAGQNLALAALTLLLVLSRRWYAFNVVGFYFAAAVVALPRLTARDGMGGKRLGGLVLNMAMIAGISSLCFLIINPALFDLFLSSRYGIAYSGMKIMGPFRNAWEIAANMGLVWVAAAIVGLRFLLKNECARPPAVRLLITAVVSFVLFCRIQYMGYHQAYLVIPTLLIFAGAAVSLLATRPSGRVRPLSTILVLALVGVNFLFGYDPRLAAAARTAEPFTTVMRRYPRTNPDYDLVRRVVDELADLTRDASRHVYVVGDGSALSPEILKRSHLPEQIDAAPFVLVNSIMDLRDGFPSQLFLADFVLLRDPPASEFVIPQQVSVQANDLLLHDPATPEYYRRARSYEAAGGEIVLLEKIYPIDTRYVDNLKERLRKSYPDHPFVYEPNYFLALSRIDPETPYAFNFWNDGALEFEKEAGKPITIRLSGLSGQATLSFDLSCWEDGLEIAVSNQEGEIFRRPIAPSGRVPYRIDVGGSDYLTITVSETAVAAPVAGRIAIQRSELK